MNKINSVIKRIKRCPVKFESMLGRNYKIRGGTVHKSVLLTGIKCTYNGINNRIDIAENCRLSNCNFTFLGNNNYIKIDKGCVLDNVTFWVEDNENYIEIGSNTVINEKTHISSIEGRKIVIGEDCVLSSDIFIRNGDSHSVLDDKGNRTNKSKDIHIGRHVWIGQKAFIGKGVCVSDQSIVGACAVLTKSFEEANVIIAGNPASIVKKNINWDRKRI